MEILTLALWILLAMTALPLGGLGALVSAGLAVQALAALTGAGLLTAFLVFSDREWLAWAACGTGIVGTLAVVAGAARLISGERSVSAVGQTNEETAALLAGVAGPLFPVCAALAAATALTTPVV